MEEKSGGKYLLIGTILVVIFIIAGFVAVIATTDDNNTGKDKNIQKVEKEKNKEKQEKENLRSDETFLKTISSLKYIEEKDLYKYEIVEDYIDEDTSDFYNALTTKKIISNISNSYQWYGTFGIFYDGDEDRIIDDEGNVLFVTDDILSYYPTNKIWEYNNNVYNSDGLLEKNAKVIDSEGYYLITEKKGELVLEDINLKPIYNFKLSEDDSMLDGSLNSIYDEQYAYISTQNYDLIVDVKNGKEVFKGETDSVNDLENNMFEINGDTCFIKNDKIAIKVKGTDLNVEASVRHFAIGNDVYDYNTLNKVDSNTFIPDPEDAVVEKLTGLELTKCRSGYGLKYKGEELLECKYETIELFGYNITKSLMSSNKLYVMISNDDYSYEIYDVYNKKIALYNIDDYSFLSPFITIYQDDNIYIYNIIDGSKTPNANGDEVELYPNYYVLTSGKTATYYNKEFKEILKTKNIEE